MIIMSSRSVARADMQIAPWAPMNTKRIIILDRLEPLDVDVLGLGWARNN